MQPTSASFPKYIHSSYNSITNNKKKISWAEELNILYSKEDVQMTNKHLKRCSTLLIIEEMQINTTTRYHLTLVRMAIIKRSTSIKCWRGCGGKETLLFCWKKCKLMQPLWKTVWRFLKLKVELPYDPAVPLLDIYLEKTLNLKMYAPHCS